MRKIRRAPDEIDKVDKKLIDLLSERLEIVEDILEFKEELEKIFVIEKGNKESLKKSASRQKRRA